MRSGIRQRINDLELLDDGSRPTVGYDQRQGIVVPRADMNIVNVEPVDLRDEVRQ